MSNTGNTKLATGALSHLSVELGTWNIGDDVSVIWVDDDEEKTTHILDDGAIVAIFKCLWTGNTMYVFESTHAQPNNGERFKILRADKLISMSA